MSKSNPAPAIPPENPKSRQEIGNPLTGFLAFIAERFGIPELGQFLLLALILGGGWADIHVESQIDGVRSQIDGVNGRVSHIEGELQILPQGSW